MTPTVWGPCQLPFSSPRLGCHLHSPALYVPYSNVAGLGPATVMRGVLDTPPLCDRDVISQHSEPGNWLWPTDGCLCSACRRGQASVPRG